MGLVFRITSHLGAVSKPPSAESAILECLFLGLSLSNESLCSSIVYSRFSYSRAQSFCFKLSSSSLLNSNCSLFTANCQQMSLTAFIFYTSEATYCKAPHELITALRLCTSNNSSRVSLLMSPVLELSSHAATPQRQNRIPIKTCPFGRSQRWMNIPYLINLENSVLLYTGNS